MGGNYDKQVDIWALGVMMYEYVTGRIPFKLDSNKKFVEAVLLFLLRLAHQFITPKIWIKIACSCWRWFWTKILKQE